MRPPSRTISAARRIRRSCGLSGCSSKYWLTERVSSGARHSAACCRYHTRPLPPGRRKSRHSTMQTLLEYAPWIVFFLVYKFGGGIYPATAALMIVMTLLLAYYWLRTRKIPQLHLALTIMVLVFGAATLILHDVRFLQWKASIVYWLIGVLFGGSVWIGKKTLL